MNRILRTIGNIYVALMLIVYPLILTNKYFNVTDTKLYVYYISTVAFLLATAGTIYIKWLRGQMDNVSLELPRKLLIGCGGILLSAFFTFLVSPSRTLALAGAVEYGLGFIYIILAVAALLALSITGFDKKIFALATITGAVISGILGLIQYIGVDLFGLLSSITLEDKNVFLSTFGNTSFFGFFMVFAFPIAAYIYFNMDDSYKYLATVAIVVSSLGVVISNTDATILAFTVELLLLSYFLGNDIPIKKKKLRLFAGLINRIAISYIGLFLLLCFATPGRELGGVQLLFINPVIWILVIVIVNVICIWGSGNRKNATRSFRILKLTAGAVIGLLILTPFIAIIYTKVTYVNLESPISRLLYLDVNWGNQRGFIWSGTLQLFENGSVIEKLVGHGIGTMSDLFQTTYEIELRELLHNFYDDAHNMYLQWLVEYGLFGLISIIYLLVTSMDNLFKSQSDFDEYRAIALVGMMIAASCLITQNITPAFLVLVLADNNSRS